MVVLTLCQWVVRWSSGAQSVLRGLVHRKVDASDVCGDERGSTLVRVPVTVLAGALALTALTTGVQVAWTDLALSSAVGATTRFASNVNYTAGSAAARRSTQDQVRQWADDVAAESHVEPDAITVVARRTPAGVDVPLDQLLPGDEVTVHVKKTVTNPLYRITAAVTDAVGGAFGHDDLLDRDGVDVKAHATNHVS
jgi:hypothetical protein